MNVIRKIIIDILKKNEGLRKLARKIVWGWRSLCYRNAVRGIRVNERLVLFETFMGRQYGCNPRAIYEAMLCDRAFDDFIFVWAFTDVEKQKDYAQLARADIVRYGSREYFRYTAAAGTLITNSNLDYRIVRKPQQCFVQTWHGTPLKRLRCDIEAAHGNANNSLDEIRASNDRDVARYSFFLSPSGFATEKFISAFRLADLHKEDILIETGYPRNDILFHYKEADRKRIRDRLGISDHKKVILYAPTFRDNAHESGRGYTYDLALDFDVLREALDKDFVILFRAHYFVASSFDFARYQGFVYDVSAEDDVSELLVISDILVTDYSSVFFDFANLRRKIVFYMYDLEEYQHQIRGFYLSTEELPGPVVTNEADLLEAIRSRDPVYDEAYAKFNLKYNHLEDGQASRRVIEKVFGNEEQNR